MPILVPPIPVTVPPRPPELVAAIPEWGRAWEGSWALSRCPGTDQEWNVGADMVGRAREQRVKARGRGQGGEPAVGQTLLLSTRFTPALPSVPGPQLASSPPANPGKVLHSPFQALHGVSKGRARKDEPGAAARAGPGLGQCPAPALGQPGIPAWLSLPGAGRRGRLLPAPLEPPKSEPLLVPLLEPLSAAFYGAIKPRGHG